MKPPLWGKQQYHLRLSRGHWADCRGVRQNFACSPRLTAANVSSSSRHLGGCTWRRPSQRDVSEGVWSRWGQPWVHTPLHLHTPASPHPCTMPFPPPSRPQLAGAPPAWLPEECHGEQGLSPRNRLRNDPGLHFGTRTCFYTLLCSLLHRGNSGT